MKANRPHPNDEQSQEEPELPIQNGEAKRPPTNDQSIRRKVLKNPYRG